MNICSSITNQTIPLPKTFIVTHNFEQVSYEFHQHYNFLPIQTYHSMNFTVGGISGTHFKSFTYHAHLVSTKWLKALLDHNQKHNVSGVLFIKHLY